MFVDAQPAGGAVVGHEGGRVETACDTRQTATRHTQIGDVRETVGFTLLYSRLLLIALEIGYSAG